MAGKRLAGHLHGRRSRLDTKHFDFGWAPARALGPWIAAVAVQVATPAYWPLAMMLRLLAANFFAGGLIARAVGRYEHAVLPMVDLLSGDTDVVLDAGWGAGLTTIALGCAFRRERIVALDHFDPDWVPGRTMFAIVSVLALPFSGKRAWRRMATSAGFESCGEGMLNGNWFVVLKKLGA